MCYVLFISFILLMINAWHKISVQTVESGQQEYKPTIVIDAGHGGEDGGAVTENGVLEKDINLDIALKLRKMFTQNDFDVIMIREDDISIYDENAETLKEKKKSDMYNRLELFNSNENNIVISIHQNKFSDSQYSGTQVFYSKNNPKSVILAECIKNSVVGLLQPDNTRQCKPADKNIFLLHNSTSAAVIVECGFLSNPQEAQLLNNDTYRNEMAFSIYMGFLEFYNTKDEQNGYES